MAVKLTVKNIPWWLPRISEKEFELVGEVLRSNYINEGEFTERFEQSVANLLGVKYAIATSSGTSALFLALAAHGIGHGDEVIVPDVTFIATANAVTLAGAKPVLADVDPATLTLSPEATRKALTSRTKAIIPVHVSGRSADMAALMEIANVAGIPVIEDAAEAFMSATNLGFLGTIGSIGCLSFSPNKTITTGQGGIALTNNDKLHIRLRELKDQGRPVRGTGGADFHHSLGYNFKLTNIQAAVGLGQLMELQHRVQRQRDIYAIYANRLSELSTIRLPGFDLASGAVPLWTDAIVDDRDALDAYLLQQGMHCRRFWFPIHTQDPYRNSDERFPVSTALMPKSLWLPSAFMLTDDDVHTVCDVIEHHCKSSTSRTHT